MDLSHATHFQSEITCEQLGSQSEIIYKQPGSQSEIIYKQPGSQLGVFVSELLEYNPWWKDEDAIKSDPEIQSWNNSKLKWNPRLRQTFKAEDYIYSLRGPRQVGKTTLVKLEIEQGDYKPGAP